MEDFATIFWIVVVVGVMIYNTLEKARKARGKGSNTPTGHGEAWPSIPEEKEKSTTSANREMPSPVSERDIAHSASAPRSAREQQDPARQPERTTGNNGPILDRTTKPYTRGKESDRVLSAGNERKSQPNVPETLQKGSSEPTGMFTQNQQPVFSTFPDECQSLEEIPDDEYTSEFETPETTDFTDSGLGALRNLPSNLSMRNPKEDQNNLSGSNHTKEENLTKIIEEFDLRRAVIYSEILKPKFEE